MWQDGSEIGERGEHSERADKGGEGSLASDVDASEDRRNDTTKHDGVKWIPVPRTDAGKEGRKWGGFVSSQCPEDSTSS